jgi:hypothetical protein
MTDHLTEDRLRTALHETATIITASLPERTFAADAAPSRRRSRSLIAAGVAATIAIVTVGTVVAIGLLRDSSPPSETVRGQTPSKDVALASFPDAEVDLEVFLRVEATETEISGVRDALVAAPAVSRFAYVDRNAALGILRDSMSCNPSRAEPFTPDVLPPSFRIETTGDDAASQLRGALTAMPGVDAIQGPPATRQQRLPCGSHTGPRENVLLTEGTDDGVAWRLLARVDHGDVCVSLSVGVNDGGHCGSLQGDEAIAAGGGSRTDLGVFSSGYVRKGVDFVRIVPPSGQSFDVPVVGQDAGFDVNFFVAFLPADFEGGHDAYEAIAFNNDGHELGRTIG